MSDETPVDGCHYCGVTYRAPHAQSWSRDVGWHEWTPPTDEQRLARMIARRDKKMTQTDGGTKR